VAPGLVQTTHLISCWGKERRASVFLLGRCAPGLRGFANLRSGLFAYPAHTHTCARAGCFVEMAAVNQMLKVDRPAAVGGEVQNAGNVAKTFVDSAADVADLCTAATKDALKNKLSTSADGGNVGGSLATYGNERSGCAVETLLKTAGTSDEKPIYITAPPSAATISAPSPPATGAPPPPPPRVVLPPRPSQRGACPPVEFDLVRLKR
jgi:hypothetical protein